MEKWNDVFSGMIPSGDYTVNIVNGEETGLVIELKNNNNIVVIKFGSVSAVRMLDEGMVQDDVYDDKAISDVKRSKFKNIIYEVFDGKFRNYINKISGGYGKALDLKHYVVITLNYCVDIVSQWEPEISVKVQNAKVSKKIPT